MLVGTDLGGSRPTIPRNSLFHNKEGRAGGSLQTQAAKLRHALDLKKKTK